jgi:hypothetical protein
MSTYGKKLCYEGCSHFPLKIMGGKQAISQKLIIPHKTINIKQQRYDRDLESHGEYEKLQAVKVTN